MMASFDEWAKFQSLAGAHTGYLVMAFPGMSDSAAEVMLRA